MMDKRMEARASINLLTIEEAADILPNAGRILVMGISGGGKSTLSKRLSARFGLDYISFDRDVFWLPGWTERPKDEQRRILRELVAGERWIMDGTNSSSFDLRLPRTDMILWVRVSRLICIWSVISRWIKFFGQTRPEMAPGCVEKIDWEFLDFIWRYEQKQTPKILKAIAEHGPNIPVFQLKNRREVRALLDLLGAPA